MSNKLKVLFLDDSAERQHEIKYMAGRSEVPWDLVQVWNYDQAVEALKEHVFDIASLDHDLGPEAYAAFAKRDPLNTNYGKEKTGLDVARFIISMPVDRRPKQCIIHSWNSHRAPIMEAELRAAGIIAFQQPFKV